MRLSQVLRERVDDVEGELLANTKLTTFCLLGPLKPQPNYPKRVTSFQIGSDCYDLIFPCVLAEAVLRCGVQFGWANDLDFEDYENGCAELDLMPEPDTPCALIRSIQELWRERSPDAERWMTLQRGTFNKAASLELLRVASTTYHFEPSDSEAICRCWQWIAQSGGFQLAVIRQWEQPYSSVY